MKVVIFAGGLGTRLMEETEARPKPMVEIGGKPILWHIMKIYEHQGFNEFVICLGYKQEMVKEYFINYYYNNSEAQPPKYLYQFSELLEGDNYIVNVPIAVSFDPLVMGAKIDFYNNAGKQYSIITY